MRDYLNIIIKLLRLPTALCLLLTAFTTCRKYPEGGYLWRSEKNLIKHFGTLQLYEVNGIDSTNLINYNGDEKFKGIYFIKEGKYSSKLSAILYPSFEHFVQFVNKNQQLHFSDNWPDSTRYCFPANSNFTGCYRLFLNPEGKPTTWDIIKLTKSELILTCTQKNNYKLIFKDL